MSDLAMKEVTVLMAVTKPKEMALSVTLARVDAIAVTKATVLAMGKVIFARPNPVEKPKVNVFCVVLASAIAVVNPTVMGLTNVGTPVNAIAVPNDTEMDLRANSTGVSAIAVTKETVLVVFVIFVRATDIGNPTDNALLVVFARAMAVANVTLMILMKIGTGVATMPVTMPKLIALGRIRKAVKAIPVIVLKLSVIVVVSPPGAGRKPTTPKPGRNVVSPVSSSSMTPKPGRNVTSVAISSRRLLDRDKVCQV